MITRQRRHKEKNAMATTKSQHNSTHHTPRANSRQESPKEMTRDLVEYLNDYARQHPAGAALACVGVGFILGWKLKPW